MAQRRAHSTIDKLSASLREALTQMLVDNIWPDDYSGDKSGLPRYEDLVAYCSQRGFSVSLSAIGRFGMRMRTLSRMKQAGVLVRDVMKDLTAEKASETQKAVAEMITAATIEFVSDHRDFTARDIKDVAKAIKDCTVVSINADKYIREQLAGKVKAADSSIDKIAAKKNIDPETLRLIKEQIYGIVV